MGQGEVKSDAVGESRCVRRWLRKMQGEASYWEASNAARLVTPGMLTWQ